ncbi:MAG: hypothetical protein AB7V56_06060 [Candidatus Nitrosocosmicus sp.]|jgi:hypothetical protein|uniref:hypothetical protein n=1 Tax=Candidatus Nitrosocosmicus agrestis TaxID=2563600 RepID=UPI00122DF34E|nr:hypothetical protein [Candidatus Nitrosocosmicus sp. SS]KAA2283297.1 hypothetical protein F1Z66_02015 [Candidatus Nitrosocosmicus sp. SS]KAF0868454.1 hypothetical protein E5N71_10220 [Candidatus Nitrosocosmicus sp. SS]MDR4491891.1 hypothetical protein [Candidatus Nitrosocosmicus sp.]HET6590284.1 hypothetical protein [Candidatus Nitrosocosmicus sp.]
MSPSTPIESKVKEVKVINCSIVLLSVTLYEDLRSAVPLIRELEEEESIHNLILLGQPCHQQSQSKREQSGKVYP